MQKRCGVVQRFNDSVDAVIDYPPANLLLDHDDALGGFGFSLKIRLEQKTDVVAFRYADKFVNVRGADKLSTVGVTKWGSSRLHVADKLGLRSSHAEILRFPFECFFIIAPIEHCDPMQCC